MINKVFKLRKESSKFKNFFKQLTVLLKIYDDFESALKGTKSNDRNNNTLPNGKICETYSLQFCSQSCLY